MPDFIKLPSERVDQLRTLAKNLNMSIADCIATFLNEQIARGNLASDIPGFSIKREGETVVLDAGAFTARLTRDLAKAYAESVKRLTKPILTPAATNPFMPKLTLDVVRRGMGIKLIDRGTGAARTLSRSVAEDFATNLARSAA